VPVALVVPVSSRLPGLLGPAAWRAVTDGRPVLALPGAAALTDALRAAGVAVEPVADVATATARGEDVVLLTGPSETGALPGVPVVDSPEPAGAGLLDVVAVMDRLRSPGGCPWDAEQTHA
jgi:XTP/dITP diphosphohydrolase